MINTFGRVTGEKVFCARGPGEKLLSKARVRAIEKGRQTNHLSHLSEA